MFNFYQIKPLVATQTTDQTSSPAHNTCPLTKDAQLANDLVQRYQGSPTTVVGQVLSAPEDAVVIWQGHHFPGTSLKVYLNGYCIWIIHVCHSCVFIDRWWIILPFSCLFLQKTKSISIKLSPLPQDVAVKAVTDSILLRACLAGICLLKPTCSDCCVTMEHTDSSYGILGRQILAGVWWICCETFISFYLAVW